MNKVMSNNEKTCRWFNNEGKLHREDGPAIEYEDGEEWYYDGVLHREDGPAFIYDETYIAWWTHGKRHRLDGPAVTWGNGNMEWWFDGHRIYCQTQEEFDKVIRLSLFW